MPTHITCPACGRKGELPDAYANRVVRCAECHESFQATVPDEGRVFDKHANLAAKHEGTVQSRRPESGADRPQVNTSKVASGPPRERKKGLLFWGILGSGIAVPLLLVAFFMRSGSGALPLKGQQPARNGTEGQPAAGKDDPQKDAQPGGRGRRGRGGRRGRNQGMPAAAAPQGLRWNQFNSTSVASCWSARAAPLI